MLELVNKFINCSKEDPLYGGLESQEGVLNLGNIALRGERGLLRISASSILRLRWNPFYGYMEGRILGMVFPTHLEQ